MDQPWLGTRETLALSISEAARICGVKRRTIRRRHQAGEFENAFKDPDGTWRIPVNDLVGAGLRPNVVTDPDEPRIVFTAASHVERLQTEVAVLRERVRALEIIAREREERVSDLRTILRMLPAHSEAEQPVSAEAERSASTEDGQPEPAAEAVQPEPAGVAEPSAPTPEIEEPFPDEPEAEFEAEAEPVPEELREEPVPESVWGTRMTPQAPAEPEELLDPLRAASPFDSPRRANASRATVSAEPFGPGEGSGQAGRPMSPPPSTEPVVILPDVPSRDSATTEQSLEQSAEMFEGARQRSTELLEDAMTLWWPSPRATGKSDDPGSFSGPVQEGDVAGYGAPGQTREGDDAHPSSTEGALPPWPLSSGPHENDPLMRDALDEASLDWLDPNFGRPPRHLRRRLGRFFRRHRKPR